MSIFTKSLITMLCGAKLLVPSTEVKEVTNDVIIEKLTYDINLLNNSLDALKVRLEDCKQQVEVANIIRESTDTFLLSNGEIGIELTDGSWASINTLTGHYEFQPVELGDWSYEADSLEEIESIIKTYIENKNSILSEVTVGCECEKLLQAQTDITEKMEEMYKMVEIEKLNR